MTRHHQNQCVDTHIMGLNDPDAIFNRDDEFDECYDDSNAYCPMCGKNNILGEVHDGRGHCGTCDECVEVEYGEE